MDSALCPPRGEAIEAGDTRFDAAAAFLVLDADRRRAYERQVVREAFRRRAEEWMRRSFDPLVLQAAIASACALGEPPAVFFENCEERRARVVERLDRSWFEARACYERLLSSGVNAERAVCGWRESDLVLMASSLGSGEKMAKVLCAAREPRSPYAPFSWRAELGEVPVVGRSEGSPYVMIDGVAYDIGLAAYGVRRDELALFASDVVPLLRHNDPAFARGGLPVELRVELGLGEAFVRGYSAERAAQLIEDDYQRLSGIGQGLSFSADEPDPAWVHGIAECFAKREMVVDMVRADEVRGRVGELWKRGATVPIAALAVEEMFVRALWQSPPRESGAVLPMASASRVERGIVERRSTKKRRSAPAIRRLPPLAGGEAPQRPVRALTTFLPPWWHRALIWSLP